ncbi:MAG TPA: alpha/beta hydrolase, partial [Gammaproteobacteria bacterium]|nr:alpha/beta hydrolase [Gammaproteobacteria bacterium]
DIEVPVLITWGQQDPFARVENADVLATLIPHSKRVVFDNASHFSSEDAGQAYVDLLIDWVEGGYQREKTA